MQGLGHAHTLKITFSTFLSTFVRLVRRILKRMWDMAVRHGFGAVRVGNEDTERLVPREEGAEQAYANTHVANDDDDNLFEDVINNTLASSPPTTSIWSTAAEHLHAPANSPHAPVDQVLGDPDYFTGSPDSEACPSLIGFGGDAEVDAEMSPPREVQQPDYGEPFLTLTEHETAAMAAVVAPVKAKLERLKEFSPDKMPGYHPDMQSNGYAKVLKQRLTTIARSIEFGKQVPQEQRFRTQLRMCRYIATEYWPLPITPTTHLDIHRIYRNAQFRQLPPAQLQQEQVVRRLWIEEMLESKRSAMSFGEAAARYASRKQADEELIAIAMAEELEDMEGRRKQEEENLKAAEELDREINHNLLGLGESAYDSSYGRGEAAQQAAGALLQDFGQVDNGGAQTQGESNQHGTTPDAEPTFATDEEYARYLWMQEQHNRGYDDMPGLTYDDPFDARETQRERDHRAAKDHAYAMQLDKEDREGPLIGIGRTRSRTAKAAQQNDESQGIGDNEDGKLVDVSPPPLPGTRSRYSLPLSWLPNAMSEYSDRDGPEVDNSEDAKLLNVSPPPSHGTRSRYTFPPTSTLPSEYRDEYREGDGREVGDSDDEKTALMANSPGLSRPTSSTKRQRRGEHHDDSFEEGRRW